ncbi:transposase [Bradyrhizobium sp. CCBAU 11430]|uniref:transposase n=1 Tax=Bradyrhizobium sp. CCBAU 11430 TaxID=1630881 RepID=UPI002306C562|nr:transposase [Bradyrhizobium sp. CCBAU 11430]
MNDEEWAQIEPHLPTKQACPVRDDDRRIISGIAHVLQCGARWRDWPARPLPTHDDLQPLQSPCKRGHWHAIFEALARNDAERTKAR